MTFRNCSYKENSLILKKKRINLKFSGFLSNFNETVIYYIRIRPINEEKGVLKPLIVLADGSFFFEKEILRSLGYEIYILQRNLTNSFEILKQMAFFSIIKGANKETFEEIINIERNFSIISNNSVFFTIKGLIKEKNTNISIENARIYINNGSLQAISNEFGKFSIKGDLDYIGVFLIIRKKNYKTKIKSLENCLNSSFCLIKLKRKTSDLELKAFYSLNSLKILNISLELHGFSNNLSLDLKDFPLNLTIKPRFLLINCSKCLKSGLQYRGLLNISLYNPLSLINISRSLNFTLKSHNNL